MTLFSGIGSEFTARNVQWKGKAGGRRSVNVLDLFSGIGGFSLGLERAGMKTVAFCEIEEFPRKVLKYHWPKIKRYKDIKNLHGKDITKSVDLICGGYPCQPFSCAGKRRGQEDGRHIWPEIARLIRELSAAGNKPSWCLFENVAGHVSMGLDNVLADLEGEGYTCWPLIIPACAINAPHRRDRLWIIANSKQRRSRSENAKVGDEGWTTSKNRRTFIRCENREIGTSGADPTAGNESAADAKGHGTGEAPQQQENVLQRERLDPDHQVKRLEREGIQRPTSQRNRAWDEPWVEAATRLCRMDDGISRRMDRSKRLKALGNSVVPQIVEIIGRAIMQAEKQ
jgi:DNA (cytosine-5)-methyltransferase 1